MLFISFIVFFPLLISQNVYADYNNLSVGVNPFGLINITHRLSNDKELKLSYKPTFGFNASFERQFTCTPHTKVFWWYLYI